MKAKQKIVLPETGADLLDMLVSTYDIRSGAALVLAQSAAQALDMALAAEALLERDGLIIDSERGSRAHPAANISRDSRNRLLAALQKLNLEL